MTLRTMVLNGLALIAVVHSASAQPKDLSEGRSMLIGCEEALASQHTFGSGLCTGMLEGLRLGGDVLEPKEIRFCVPESVTEMELVAAVVKWMKQHPKELESHFSAVAVKALSFTWPCKS